MTDSINHIDDTASPESGAPRVRGCRVHWRARVSKIVRWLKEPDTWAAMFVAVALLGSAAFATIAVRSSEPMSREERIAAERGRALRECARTITVPVAHIAKASETPGRRLLSVQGGDHMWTYVEVKSIYCARLD